MDGQYNLLDKEALFQKALEALEFPQVLERLAAHTRFSRSAEMALAITPAFEHWQVVKAQDETAEARQLIDMGHDPDTGCIKDVREAVERAGLGGMLSAQELLEIQSSIRGIMQVRQAISRQSDLPILTDMARQIPDLTGVEAEIERCIGRGGEVLDRASPRLAEMRQEARNAHARLEASFQRLLKSLHGDGYLQEPLISQRHGRMVLWVKVERQSHVPGIVHDVSDSGATLFVEPLSAVSLGNQWQEARLAVEREEQRVLQMLSQAVGSRHEDLLLALDIVARIDLALAKARFAIAMRGTPVAVVYSTQPFMHFVDARHPLLSGDVVANTIELGQQDRVMLITGPNAGGKTVALKTAGVLALMAQAGLQLPAREAAISIFDAFYADIGDQQSIQRSLSTFSSHAHNMASILHNVTSRSLVLIDELGTSTDPEEGAALAKALLLAFHERGVTLIATSHHRDVASLVQETPGMMNASVELDPTTLAPTYRLTPGLPGRSYALTIASRLGIPAEVTESARSLLSAEHVQAEGLITELQQERARAAEMRAIAERERQAAEEARRELEKRLEVIEDEKAALLEQTRQELEAKAEEVLRRLREAERAIAKVSQGTGQGLKEERRDLTALRRELRSSSWQSQRVDRQWVQALKPGDWVYVRGIPHPVEVLSAPGEDGAVEVVLGAMRARILLDSVQRKADVPASARPAPPRPEQVSRSRTGADLDLRGMRVEAALDKVDLFLDKALRDGLTSVRIIHGAGTGALRAALREYLSTHRLVKSSQPEPSRSTDGATIVELV